MKKILDQIPHRIDHAFRQFAASAQKPANLLRWFFFLMFAVASFWAWANEASVLFIYPVIATLWLMAAVLFRLFHQTDLFMFATWVDVAIISTGLLLCALFGVFNAKGFILFLCYFPVLAMTARRYNLLFVFQVGAGITVIYTVLSLWALGALPLPRILALGAMTLAAIALAKTPKSQAIAAAQTAAREAYELGASEKEAELMAVVHKQFFPPAQYEMPGLYVSYKHGVGTATSGDFYYAFETLKGPMVILGDLPGKGFDAAIAATQLQQYISELAQEKSTLSELLIGLNAELRQKNQRVTCVVARWEGPHLHYINAGHLPAIRISRREPELLPVNATALGTEENPVFIEEVIEFAKGDLLLLYTDGAYAGLASDPQTGSAEMLRLAQQFNNGEVNTICHRIFDCGQPEYTQAPDDSTVVIVRRQEFAAEVNG